MIEKQLQEKDQIVFVSFEEESALYPTYKIENKSDIIKIEYYQKDYPHHAQVINPKQSQVFSWTNPSAEYKILCKYSLYDSNQPNMIAKNE